MSPEGWAGALERAGRIATAGQPSALCTETHWDYVGVRGILAIVLWSLADDGRLDVEGIPLREVLDHCERGPAHVRALAAAVVGEELANGLDADPHAAAPTAGDSPVTTWLWLTRRWPPTVPDGRPRDQSRRWDGMSRGIARDDPGAAVDILTGWAAGAAAAAIGTE
ncbi:hypothetical protein [Streptomyces sp. NPDC059783]|uniref:hypothetical protein n=1 Tax=Streptomyces sp. NPDC059783 TaxID=3346944 RepID=UPI0036643AF3